MNKTKRLVILLSGLAFILFACHQAKEEKVTPQSETFNASASVEKLAPLAEGEFHLKDKDFGEIIELTGTTHPVDKYFSILECEMLALDSILIVKNNNNTDMFMVFALPSFEFMQSFGHVGKGPGEFQIPHLIKDDSGEFLGFIYERTNSKLYALDRNFEISDLQINFQDGADGYSDKQLCGLSSQEFLYVATTNDGKAIFHIESKNDSTQSNLLKSLAFSDEHKNWTSYIGDFGANSEKKRAVFAYKYFKRLLFYDFENNISKVVYFDQPEIAKSGNPASMLEPTTVTHYWGMSAQSKYVYVLYSGRTPIEVSKQNNNSSGYLYLEVFDWNGNPVSKYKLDHWGYFCVNENEDTIYLASTTDEQPFISYTLPDRK